MHRLLVAFVLCTLGVPATAQEPFPLAGRWTYFDFGTRAPQADELAEACRNSWDSISPDGGFASFNRNEMGEIAVELAGFCEMQGETAISCTYLIDVTGPIAETYTDEIGWASPDIVDYIIRRENGKPDTETSWTYVRCPADIRTFR